MRDVISSSHTAWHSFTMVAYPALGGTKNCSTIHAFTQKLVPMQDSVDATSSELGYGYYRLQQQAMFYRKRLAQLNVALHNRVLSAYECLLPS
jgi:hypothetical protein